MTGASRPPTRAPPCPARARARTTPSAVPYPRSRGAGVAVGQDARVRRHEGRAVGARSVGGGAVLVRARSACGASAELARLAPSRRRQTRQDRGCRFDRAPRTNRGRPRRRELAARSPQAVERRPRGSRARQHHAKAAATPMPAPHGAALVPPNARILTHCNAGALATAGYGTALGVVRAAHAQGKVALVWVDETRPVMQGSRLTRGSACARESARLIADVAAASVMARGEVDLGRDRGRPDRRQRRHRQTRSAPIPWRCSPPTTACRSTSRRRSRRSTPRSPRRPDFRSRSATRRKFGGWAGSRPRRATRRCSTLLRRHARGAHRGDRHRARRRASAVSLLTAREVPRPNGPLAGVGAHERPHARVGHQAVPVQVYSDLPAIPLPREIDPGGPRYACRARRAGAGPPKLGLGELTAVLYYAAGVTRKKTYRAAASSLRAAVSTGALFQTEGIRGGERGLRARGRLYHFCPGDFALRRLRPGDVRGALAASAADDSLASRAATVLLTGIYWRKRLEVSGARLPAPVLGLRHDARQLLAVAGALGLAPRVLTGFVDAR